MKCPSCGKEFEYADGIRHLYGNYMATFVCPYCNLDLTDESKMMK